MKYTWGDASRKRRAELDPRLQRIVDELLKYADVTIVCGYRGEEEQERLFREGKSKARWLQSKHNTYPSLAVDIQPYPLPANENDLRAGLGYLAGLAMAIADAQGVRLRWGGDWNMNGSVADNGFDDLYHLEIVEWQDG